MYFLFVVLKNPNIDGLIEMMGMYYVVCTYFCAVLLVYWDLVNGRKLRPFKDLSKREFMTPLFFWKVEDFPD